MIDEELPCTETKLVEFQFCGYKTVDVLSPLDKEYVSVLQISDEFDNALDEEMSHGEEDVTGGAIALV